MENIDKELLELKRVVQYLNREEDIPINLKQLKQLFLDAEETKLTDDVWSELENTESNTIQKGDMDSVFDIADKYGKSNPEKLKEKLLNNTYDRPLIVKFDDRYHLVAGNTRLSTAAALGMNPYVIIADIPSKLTKDTEGIEKFMEILDDKFNLNYELLEFIVYFIENSGCEKIEFEDFRFGAMGLALHDRVLINNRVLFTGLENVLFIIFHEIAHQYQFKKYGKDKMYECYLNNLPIEEAASFMKKTEMVADEFAFRKIRELQSRDLISKNFKPMSPYKNMSIETFSGMVEKYRNDMDSRNITSPEGISEFFYNMIKNNLS
jgi:hypothetical protein